MGRLKCLQSGQERTETRQAEMMAKIRAIRDRLRPK
jgi:hypothetical protein